MLGDGRCCVHQHGSILQNFLGCRVLETSLLKHRHVMFVEGRVFGQLLIERYLSILDLLKHSNLLIESLDLLLKRLHLLSLLLLSKHLLRIDPPLLLLLLLHISICLLDLNLNLLDRHLIVVLLGVTGAARAT